MTADQLRKKCAREQQVVSQMIAIYCKGTHGTRPGALCEQCAQLERYARLRAEQCPFMERKTFCAHCTVHCYQPQMRKQIRAVMRYAGPRMLWRRPCLTLYHIWETQKEKTRMGKRS